MRILVILSVLFLSGCVSQTTQQRDPRLTEDCPLVQLPAGDVSMIDVELTLLDQWTAVVGCNDRFKQLRNIEE